MMKRDKHKITSKSKTFSALLMNNLNELQALRGGAGETLFVCVFSALVFIWYALNLITNGRA